MLTVTENGYGKRTSAYEYRITGRGGQGIIAITTSERNGDVVASLHAGGPAVAVERLEVLWTDPAPWERLDHGYDEHKKNLDINDLRSAAKFRGGKLTSRKWDGDLYSQLNWGCAFGHSFTARPFTVLKAGHWCPKCEATWNGDERAKKNPFFAQVWYADHSTLENNKYPKNCINDIKDADKEYESQK